MAVYNADGALYATQGACTHRGGPLSEGDLAGHVVTCPLHGSQFDVTTGQVLQGPATEPLTCYRVIVDGEIGRVEPIAEQGEIMQISPWQGFNAPGGGRAAIG